MQHFKTIAEMHRASGLPAPQNPLLSVFLCQKELLCFIAHMEFTSDFYSIGFKKMRSGVFSYGRTKYDHEHGSLSFIKPQQLIELRDLELEEDGFWICFHEDYLNGHFLHSDIRKYGYFEYETNEALHVSPREQQIIWDLYRKIEAEYNNNEDEYSREIILTHIDSILKYAQRFYKRQFINRTDLSGATVSRFNELLLAYSGERFVKDKGLPTVKAMAEQLRMSPRYLRDLLKQETGKTAIELIHSHLVTQAKHLLTIGENNVSETAWSLGFENLPYFSRLFKREVGMSPNQYKRQALN
jgi:AraC family transcriptional activator of pobA